MLYEREEASKQIVNILLNSSGLRLTPICDHCFGAGKTSLMFKFRNILNNLPPDQWRWPERSETLRNAVYVHVSLNMVTLASDKVDFLNSNSIDMMLIEKFKHPFAQSFQPHQKEFNLSSFMDFATSATSSLPQSVKFLVHIDEVGFFDHHRNGKNVLYRILHFGEAFRTLGHFYVVTGRSRYLHTIGLNNISDSPFSSPCLTELIPLPLLSINSVISMFKEYKKFLPNHLFDSNGEPNQDAVNHLYHYSDGVPRAIYFGLLCYRKDPNATKEEVEEEIRKHCQLNLDSKDTDLFNLFLELDDYQIRCNDNVFLNNERITDIIARLGIYRDNYRKGGTFYT